MRRVRELEDAQAAHATTLLALKCSPEAPTLSSNLALLEARQDGLVHHVANRRSGGNGTNCEHRGSGHRNGKGPWMNPYQAGHQARCLTPARQARRDWRSIVIGHPYVLAA